MKPVLGALFMVFACGGAEKPAIRPVSAPATAPVTLSAQIDQGKQLYVARCAKCHGDAGQGTDKAPLVVGKQAFPQKPRAGAKRDVEFHSAADVFAWATKQMPADDPGSLTTEQYLAIFAFDLTANGVTLEHPLDGPTAQGIVLHP